MMTNKYCPKGKIKKLEVEMWNLKVKGTDVVSYNQRFQELALMCARMFPEESDKIERYVGGLPDMIHGSLMTSKPKTIQDAIEFATELMDKKISTFAEWSGEKKPYGGSKPLCSKCNYHHDGQRAPKCHKCNKVGHLACDCRSIANANTANNQRGTRAGGNGNAPAKVYAVGHPGTKPRLNRRPITKYMLKGCHVFLAHFTIKETEDKVMRRELVDVRSFRFPKHLIDGPVRNERIVGPTEGAIRQRLYKAQFLTLGSSGLVCQEEGWIILNVHRLPRIEQADDRSRFEWGDKQEAAFQTLMNKLCSAPILALHQGAENFILYCDASHKGLDSGSSNRGIETRESQKRRYRRYDQEGYTEGEVGNPPADGNSMLIWKELVPPCLCDLRTVIMHESHSLNIFYPSRLWTDVSGHEEAILVAQYEGRHRHLSVLLDGLHIDDKLYFVEEPVEIIDRQVKQLKQIHIPIIKVRWNSRRGPEFTWEHEDQFQKKYPHLFTKTAPSSSAAS
ncbi:putative reverse transcriptase domain-containing protein [Tanacetum coccineum]